MKKLKLVALTVGVGFVSTVIAMESNADDVVSKERVLQYLPESTPATRPPQAILSSAASSAVQAPSAASASMQPSVEVDKSLAEEVDAASVNDEPKPEPKKEMKKAKKQRRKGGKKRGKGKRKGKKRS